MSEPAAIETHGLTKQYGRARGIESVDLRVGSGEVFGFLGPNGAGKTTLIRTLLDLIRPTNGRAMVLGLHSQADSLAIRRRTAYLPGDLALYDRLTAGEHLHWLADLGGGVAPGRIEALAERFQLDLSRRIKELSKGNRQKVGIVQALMRDAELYVLDEPTAGLDPVMQHLFHQTLTELATDGRTVFLSSHQLDEVQQVAQRVGIIREGRLVAVEEVDALRARSVRHVSITFDGPVPRDELVALDAVHDLEIADSTARFRLDGSIDPVIKTVARHSVADFDSQAADLDEIFLTFYADAEEPEPGDSRDELGPHPTGVRP